MIGRAASSSTRCTSAELSESESRDVVDHDCAGRQLDPSKAANKLAHRQIDEAGRRVAGILPENRPSPGEREQQTLCLVVGEQLHHLSASRRDRRWEVLSEDRTAVIENDAQRPPIGSDHAVRTLRRPLDQSD